MKFIVLEFEGVDTIPIAADAPLFLCPESTLGDVLLTQCEHYEGAVAFIIREARSFEIQVEACRYFFR